jgi:hypothetical protein
MAEPSQVAAYEAAQSEDEQEQILFKALGADGVVMKLAAKIRQDTMQALGKSTQGMSDDAVTRAFCAEMYKQLYRMTGLYLPPDTKKQFALGLAQYGLLQIPGSDIGVGAELAMNSILRMQQYKQPTPKLADVLSLVIASAPARTPAVAPEALAAQFQRATPLEKAQMLAQSVRILLETRIQPAPMSQFIALQLDEYGARIVGSWDPSVTPSLWASANFDQRIRLIQHAEMLLRQRSVDVLDDEKGPQIAPILRSQVDVPSNEDIVTRYFGRDAERTSGLSKDKLYRCAESMYANEILYGFANPAAMTSGKD